MLSATVVLAYFLLSQLALKYISFIKKTQLTFWVIFALFSVKVIAGIVYGYFYMQPGYIETSDTWRYFQLSKTETDWLIKDPTGFIKDIFTYGYDKSGGLFSGENSYWNDLKSTLIIKMIAICNVFTAKNYFANVVVFNFIFFFGNIAFYRVLKSKFPETNISLVIAAFLIPSYLFWCSGVHKDGFIFLAIAVIIFCVNKQLAERKISWLKNLCIILFMLLLFAFRNFMALLLIPGLILWILLDMFSAKRKAILFIFFGVAIACIALSFLPQFPLHFGDYIIAKQNEFKELTGGSQIDVPELHNSLISFIYFLPTAADIAFVRPHITEMKNVSYMPAILEIVVMWLLVLYAVIAKRRQGFSPSASAFLWGCLVFCIAYLLVAGYTITFSGAIVRYRAVILPFLFAPILLKLEPFLAGIVLLVRKRSRK